MGRHRGWRVSAPGTSSVGYPSRARARSVARQVKGAKVSGSGCPLLLLTLPLWALLIAVRLIKTSAAAAPCGMGGPRAAGDGRDAPTVLRGNRTRVPASLARQLPPAGQAPTTP